MPEGEEAAPPPPTVPPEFESARKLFPGDKRGSAMEWANFQKATRKLGLTTAGVIPLLAPAIKAEMLHKFNLRKSHQFCPEWAMFSTWVNQGRWTQELAKAPSAASPGPSGSTRVPYDPMKP